MLAGKCMELEIILLGKRSQMKTNVTCFLLYVESRPKKKNMSVNRGLFMMRTIRRGSMMGC
jgi:hypothetical protein